MGCALSSAQGGSGGREGTHCPASPCSPSAPKAPPVTGPKKNTREDARVRGCRGDAQGDAQEPSQPHHCALSPSATAASLAPKVVTVPFTLGLCVAVRSCCLVLDEPSLCKGQCSMARQLRQIKNTPAAPRAVAWTGRPGSSSGMCCCKETRGCPGSGTGWGIRWGTPIFPLCAPALLHISRVLGDLFLLLLGRPFQYRWG